MPKKNWLERFLTPDTDRAERRSPDLFAAHRWAGSELKKDPVRDISTTGVYVITRERWPLGTILAITMQKDGPLEISPERRITAIAKVVRHGNQGMGLAFLAPQTDNERLWKQILDTFIQQLQAKDMLHLVRMSEAIAFLSQICPDGPAVFSDLVTRRLSSNRVELAAGIILYAQALYAAAPTPETMRVHLDNLNRILEDGSIATEDWVHQLWAGLLVASMSADGSDKSNMRFIELFCQLTPIPARILTIVCAVSSKFLTESGTLAAKPLACSLSELATASGSRNTQLKPELERLTALGLVECKEMKTKLGAEALEIQIVPTLLGLQLFARCNGHQGPPQQFYTLDQPVTPIPLAPR